MLEILALIYLSRKIGNLADQKGQKRGLWQFYTVIAWFGAEFLGAFLSVLVFSFTETLAAYPFAIGFAVGSYFLIKTILSKKPDVTDTAFEFEQQNQPQ